MKDYNYDSPGFSTATGHFTQVVWKDTTYLGCAVNTNCEWATYLCQYRAPGNVLSLNWTEQVLRPSALAGLAAADDASDSAVTQPTPVPVPALPPVSPEVTRPEPASNGSAISNATTIGDVALATAATASALNATEIRAVLVGHNRLRQQHKAPALTWDADLAKAAQAWADGCPWAASKTKGVGESIAWGVKEFGTVIAGWYAEVSRQEQ